ncbi:MAG: hypothetical protein D6E12_18395 [Desulfovibrio sp.]|nr:MAG: hypothetical protein D6E12_18395 [Desulfovibrio sp.]
MDNRATAISFSILLILLTAPILAPGAWGQDFEIVDEVQWRYGGELSFIPPGRNEPVSGRWEATARLVPATGAVPDEEGMIDAVPVLDIGLEGVEVNEEWGWGEMSLSGVLGFEGGLMTLAGFTLTSDDFAFSQGRGELAGPWRITGEVEENGQGWLFSDLDISAGESLRLAGVLQYGDDDSLVGSFTGQALDMQQVIAAHSDHIPESLGGTSVSGPLDLAVDISLDNVLSEQGMLGAVTASLGFGGNGLALAGEGDESPWLDAQSVAGELWAEVELAREGVLWRVRGDMALDRTNWPVTDLDMDFALIGGERAVNIERMVLTPRGGPLRRPLQVAGSINMGEHGEVATRDLRITAQGLGELDAWFAMEESPAGPVMNGTLDGEDLAVGDLLALVQEMGGPDLAGWNPSGSADLNLSLVMQENVPVLGVDLGLSGVAFMSPDGAAMADKLGFAISGDVTLADQTVLDLTLTVGQGEALYDKYYLNFANAALTLNWQGTDRGGGRWSGLNAQLRLADHCLVTARGGLDISGESPDFSGSVQVTEANLAKLFETFVRSPNKLTQPGIAAMAAAGEAELSLDVEARDGAAAVSGHVSMTGGAIRRGEPGDENHFSVTGMDLDLPFSYLFGQAPDGTITAPAPPTDWGRFQAASMSLPVGGLDSLDLPLYLAPGRLEVGGSLVLDVLGGDLELRDIVVGNPLTGDFQLACSGSMRGADLTSVDLGEVPLMGELNGRFPAITLDSNRLNVAGEISGSFFAGGVVARNIAMEKPFARDRRLMADIEMTALDLERISEATGIGTVTGKLDVIIEDLVIAYGQPAALFLTAYSVETDGIDQEISLKAVNSISVMSTGSGITGLGVGVFASFFETFAYEAIGFTCSLVNDEFQVRGLIKEGGVEYLIQKPLMFGINVINMNPENRISFSDMLERIQRVIKPENPDKETPQTE